MGLRIFQKGNEKVFRIELKLKYNIGEGTGNSFQNSCLGNPIDRGAWWVTVHEVARVRHDLVTKPSPRPKIYQNLWDTKCVRITVPPSTKYAHVLVPRTCEYVTFHGKKDFGQWD